MEELTLTVAYMFSGPRLLAGVEPELELLCSEAGVMLQFDDYDIFPTSATGSSEDQLWQRLLDRLQSGYYMVFIASPARIQHSRAGFPGRLVPEPPRDRYFPRGCTWGLNARQKSTVERANLLYDTTFDAIMAGCGMLGRCGLRVKPWLHRWHSSAVHLALPRRSQCGPCRRLASTRKF